MMDTFAARNVWTLLILRSKRWSSQAMAQMQSVNDIPIGLMVEEGQWKRGRSTAPSFIADLAFQEVCYSSLLVPKVILK